MDETAKRQFETDGYVIVRGLVPREDCAELLASVQRLRDTPADESAAPVAIQNQFGRGQQLQMVKLNQLTTQLPEFRDLAHRADIVDVVESLIGPGARVFRDVVVVKPGRTGGVLRHHQDSAYWDVEPKNLVSAWIALSDAPVESGPLSVVPGSHGAPIPHSLALTDRIPVPRAITSVLRGLVSRAGTGDNVATASGSGVLWQLKRLVLASSTRFAPVLASLADYHIRKVDSSRCTVIGAAAGDVVFFHSLLVHGTGLNTTSTDRVVDIVSYMPSNATLPRADVASFPMARR